MIEQEIKKLKDEVKQLRHDLSMLKERTKQELGAIKADLGYSSDGDMYIEYAEYYDKEKSVYIYKGWICTTLHALLYALKQEIKADEK